MLSPLPASPGEQAGWCRLCVANLRCTPNSALLDPRSEGQVQGGVGVSKVWPPLKILGKERGNMKPPGNGGYGVNSILPFTTL